MDLIAMRRMGYFLLAVALLGCARGKYVDRDPSPMKSLPGDLSVHALFVGESFLSYRFFENSDDRPFKPDVEAFDAIDAWWCAEASLLAYVPEAAFVRGELARAGFGEIDFFYRHGRRAGPDTQFFVAAREDVVLVSFRGSEVNVADWVTNARFVLRPFDGGRVHSGFLQALDEAWGEGGLGRRLERLHEEDPRRPIWFTGHSLGGAVATLAAARWFEGHTTSTGAVYTFGAPRVGDAGFCKSIRFPLWRVIHNTDIVPLVPTGVYEEAGGMKWIDERGELRDEWNPQSVTIGSNVRFLFSNWRRGRWVWIPRDVVDHSPLYYAICFYNRGVDEVD